MLTLTFIALALSSTAAGQAPAAIASDARQIFVGVPQMIVQIDAGKAKGEPWRLAWSPDGTELYLQTADRDSRGTVKSTRSFLVPLGAKTLKGIDQEPGW